MGFQKWSKTASKEIFLENYSKSDFESYFKVILKGFQSDFSCKNGAKLLPVEIFLENYSKK